MTDRIAVILILAVTAFCILLAAIIFAPSPVASWAGIGALSLLVVGVLFWASPNTKPPEEQ